MQKKKIYVYFYLLFIIQMFHKKKTFNKINIIPTQMFCKKQISLN